MSFGRADKIHCLGVNGCPICKEQAVKLSKLKIYRGNNQYVYTLVYKKLNGTEKTFVCQIFLLVLFLLAGGWGTKLSFYEVFRLSWPDIS